MTKLTARQRLLLGGAAAMTVALGIGEVAHAAGDGGVAEQGYVTIEDSAVTTPAVGVEDGTTPALGDTTASRDGRDCPDKDGSGNAAPGQQDQGTTPGTSDLQERA